jgi:hypothetical protein
VDEVPPAGKGRIMTSDETLRELEQDLKNRYPRAQVSVTDKGDQVTVAVNQPNDSIRLKIDTARIEGGSAVLARILGRRADLPAAFSRMDSRNPGMTDFNPRKPNIARIYDALRDGKDNFAPDREAAGAIRGMAADGQRAAHDNRAFLRRAVRFLANEQGISQFLDIGSGMPGDQNTHEIALETSPRARVAYLDNDPVVTGHARAVLEDHCTAIALPGDLRNPQRILTGPALRGFIDLRQPVAVLLLAVLHFIEDSFAHEAARTIMRQVLPEAAWSSRTPQPTRQPPARSRPSARSTTRPGPPSSCARATRSRHCSAAWKSSSRASPTSTHGETPPTSPPGRSATAALRGTTPDHNAKAVFPRNARADPLTARGPRGAAHL